MYTLSEVKLNHASQLLEAWTELYVEASYPYRTIHIAATMDIYLEEGRQSSL